MTADPAKTYEFLNEVAARLDNPADIVDAFTRRRALQEISRAIPHAASRTDLNFLWGLAAAIHLFDEHLAEAESAYRNAIRALPDDPHARLGLGTVLTKLDRTKDAVAAYITAHDLAHDNVAVRATSLLQLCGAYARLGHEEAALDSLAEAIRVTPADDALTLLRIAHACAQHGHEDDAVEFLARYFAARNGEPRGDRPALEVIGTANVGSAVTISTELANALSTVQAREDSPMPEELRWPEVIRLSPAAWARFTELAGI